MRARWVPRRGKVAHRLCRRLLITDRIGAVGRLTACDGDWNCRVAKDNGASAVRLAKQGRLRDRSGAHFINARDGRVLRMRAARHTAVAHARAWTVAWGQIQRSKRFSKHGLNRCADSWRAGAVTIAESVTTTAIAR